MVVERDSSYKTASATLSAGGLRQQFSLLENVQMSLYGLEFVRGAPELLEVEGAEPVDLQFQERGYLFLASEAGRATLERRSRREAMRETYPVSSKKRTHGNKDGFLN